jgi:copper chaperone
MATATYEVRGMTCGHCVKSVTEELQAVDGVSAVDVDLNAGGVSTVTVTSDTDLDEQQVRAAVDEAGYELV